MILGNSEGFHIRIAPERVGVYIGYQRVAVFTPRFKDPEVKAKELIKAYGGKWTIRFVSNFTWDFKYIQVDTEEEAMEIARTRMVKGNKMINHRVDGVFAPIDLEDMPSS